MMPLSDAETVLDEDSPLSPCLWTPTVENQRQLTAKLQTRTESSSEDKPSGLDCSLHALHHELKLSPASQLNVLSQISELADAQSRQTGAASRLTQQTQRSNVWGAALQTAKRKRKTSRPAVATRIQPKRLKQMQKQTQSQAERLAADMLDWETCSEGDLFAHDAGAEEDPWVYDEIDDSDFEDELNAS